MKVARAVRMNREQIKPKSSTEQIAKFYQWSTKVTLDGLIPAEKCTQLSEKFHFVTLLSRDSQWKIKHKLLYTLI